MSSIHYAPDGCTTEQHITEQAVELLGRTRKQGGFEFHFRAIAPVLHKGAVVHRGDVRTKLTRKSGQSSSEVSGVVCEAPQNVNLLLPFHKKTARIQWNRAADAETVGYDTLVSPLLDNEKELCDAFRDIIGAHLQDDGFVNTSTLSNELCDVQLHGELLIVQCETEALANDLRSATEQVCTSVSNVTTYAEEEKETHTKYMELPLSRSVTGPQLHTSKVARTPCNRKQFTQKLRQDDALNACLNDNVAKQSGHTPCNQWQPEDMVGKQVVVPHWKTNGTIATYVLAKATAVNQHHRTIDVVHKQHSRWSVPMYHVHPTTACSEVAIGAVVFCTSNHAKEDAVTTHRITEVLSPNHRLVCGIATQQPVEVSLPTPFSVQALNKSLSASGVTGVHASFSPDKNIVFTSTQARFTLWSTSSCAAILGFDDGRTYETEINSETRKYTLMSPHQAPVHTTPTLVRTTTEVAVTPTHPSGAAHTTQRVGLSHCIPMRHVYSKDTTVYAHLSSYQHFPIRYFCKERLQRGLLLFHEMGSGKSRTSIEMAQRDVEHRFWSSVASAKEPFHAHQWKSDKPRIVIMSPTQEARDHYLEECAVWLASRWTERNGVWFPVQHQYTSYDASVLQEEVRTHQKRVLQHLKQYVLLPIVYTNNTKRLYSVIQVFRKCCVERSISPDDRSVLNEYFQRQDSDRDFVWDTAVKHADDMYARVFTGTFVVVDEIHNLCNAIAKPTEISACGTFFYRALMEAMDCRVVGLTGTPIQRTALSIAPLFNILRGKHVVCRVLFSTELSTDVRETIFASFRPFAQSVWVDCKQSNNSHFVFTPWHTLANVQELQSHIFTMRKKYPNNLRVEQRDTELFPFAFHYAPHSRSARKTYLYNNTSFLQKYVKQNGICNIGHFLLRINGLVSYVSPPKDTTDRTTEYPKYNIHTVHVSAHASHLAYLQAIVAQKRAISQKQGDVEARSGCNVNWKVVPREVMRGKDGLLKLFFKGGAKEASPTEIVQQYHQLLSEIHHKFLDVHKHPKLQPLLDVNQQLSVFSPKIHYIVRSLLSRREDKSVVYSDFIDGVGEWGVPVGQRQRAQAPNAMDGKHVGLSGLGLLGYTLKHNGYVQLKLCVHHPLHHIHRKLWERWGNKRDVFLALGPRRCKDTNVLSCDELTLLCKEADTELSSEEARGVARDIHWERVTTRVCDLCRHCLLREEFSNTYIVNDVQHRISIEKACREKLLATKRAMVYAEYSDRVVSNGASKEGRQCAKQTLLHLYNVRSSDALSHLPFTAQTVHDLRTLLGAKGAHTVPHTQKRRSKHQKKKPSSKATANRTPTPTLDRGNANGSLVHTLLVSMGVTEGVEFKDVRTMHILEPPKDYRKLEQMFGRVIRRGSHNGLPSLHRDVNIYLYILTGPNSLDTVRRHALGQPHRVAKTADEHYWTRVIRRKYDISQEFYQMMKHMATDCTHNLVLNSASFQDRALTCFEYPYQKNLQDWQDSEAPLYSPLEDDDGAPQTTRARAIDLHKVRRMVQHK